MDVKLHSFKHENNTTDSVRDAFYVGINKVQVFLAKRELVKPCIQNASMCGQTSTAFPTLHVKARSDHNVLANV